MVEKEPKFVFENGCGRRLELNSTNEARDWVGNGSVETNRPAPRSKWGPGTVNL